MTDSRESSSSGANVVSGGRSSGRTKRVASIEVEIDNRSGEAVDADRAVELARRVLAGEGVESGDLGLAFVGAEEIRELKRKHLGIDEATDALAFPIDGVDALPDGLPRQLGDVVVCPQVVGEAWRAPLVHALLHLLGHDHGAEMEAREALYL
jgi:probable rRNA maturation factor